MTAACTLAPFDPSEACPACGASSMGMGTRYDWSTGHLARRCLRCGYQHAKAPLFDPASPPLMRRHRPGTICPACLWRTDSLVYLEELEGLAEDKWLSPSLRGGLCQALSADLEDLLPFLGAKCSLCWFCWPELPLNRAQSVTPVMPLCLCTGLREGSQQ